MTEDAVLGLIIFVLFGCPIIALLVFLVKKEKKARKQAEQNPSGRLYVDWSAYEEAQKPRPADEQSRPAVPQISCPRCGCTQIYAGKKGFSAGKAIAGGLIAGPVGLVGGAIGQNKVVVTCLGCGHKWKV